MSHTKNISSGPSGESHNDGDILYVSKYGDNTTAVNVVVDGYKSNLPIDTAVTKIGTELIDVNIK